MIAKLLSFLLALALAGGPALEGKGAKTAPLPEKIFHGCGILDLNSEDTTHPIRVRLGREPGSFVRVLMPESFGKAFHGYEMVIDEGLGRYHRRTADGRDSIDFLADPYCRDRVQATVAFQEKSGRAIILVFHFTGRTGSLGLYGPVNAYLRAHDWEIPVDPGPPIHDLKPTILLGELSLPKSDPRSKASALKVIRDGKGKVRVELKSPIEIGRGNEKETLPAGTKFLGKVRPFGGDLVLWVDTAVMPDGTMRQVFAMITIGKVPKAKGEEDDGEYGLVPLDLAEA